MKGILIICTFLWQAQAWGAFEAAYIDMQKAIQTTKAGVDAKKTLETEFNKKKDQLKKKEGELKKEADEFEKKRMVLSEKVREEKQMELQKKMMEFQQELQQSQVNIQKKEGELTRPILEKMQKVIEQVAKDKGYAMVFEKSGQGVMWAKSELDITDAVIKEFEKTK